MKALRFTLSVCVCLTTALTVFGQTPTTPEPKELSSGGVRVERPDLNARGAQIQKSFEVNSGLKKESRVIKSGVLAPAASEIESHKQFLSQKNTGLIRLLPRGAYNIKRRGGGAYYSFFYLSHDYGYGSDIELDLGLLHTGFAGADYGILTNIGDVPLDEVTLEDARVTYLAGYRAPSREPEARTEFKRSSRGFTNNGMLYARMALAEVDSTYLLRSVVYDKSDVLVAFRVVRIDQDESVILAWKLLKKYSTPTLSR